MESLKRRADELLRGLVGQFSGCVESVSGSANHGLRLIREDNLKWTRIWHKLQISELAEISGQYLGIEQM
jgi:hypothetical protein